MEKRVALVGYYGYDNLGDDLMLWCLLNEMSLKVPDCKITLLAKTSENLETICGQFDNVTLKPFKSHAKFYNLWLYLKTIISHQMIIWGGGTCFSDEDGIGNYKYFLINNLLRKKYSYLAIGLGNLNAPKSLKRTKFLLKNAHFVTFRDIKSFEFSKKICDKGNFYLTSDLAYLHKYASSDQDDGKNKSENYILISLRDLSKFYSEKDIIVRHSALKSFLLELIHSEGFTKVVFLPIDTEKDFLTNELFKRDFEKTIKSELKLEIIKESDFRLKMELIANSSLNITERLHSMVISEFDNVPCLALSYSPKIDRFYELDLKESNYISYKDTLTKEVLWKSYESFGSQKTTDFDQKRKKLIEQAERNIEILTEYLAN